jgi:hypothetical protein
MSPKHSRVEGTYGRVVNDERWVMDMKELESVDEYIG